MKTKGAITAPAEFDKITALFGTQRQNPDEMQRRTNPVPKTTITLCTFHRRALSAMLAFTVFVCVCAGLANAQVITLNDVTVFNVLKPQTDFSCMNAPAMPLPINTSAADSTQALIEALLSPPPLGAPGYSPGAEGTGVMRPVFLRTPGAVENDVVTPDDIGTNNHPFSTARADLYTLATNTHYPYRPAGKLCFTEGTASAICSASLIKRGVVVTAAHCVANYGKSQFYTGWQFAPGYRNGTAPYGVWTAKQVWIKNAYYNGTDGCVVSAAQKDGVICPDDVALIVLDTQGGDYPGTSTGWLGYGYGGYGFTSNGLTHITELGYPSGLDNATYMERDDSQGFVSSSNANNTIIGSNMNGGSSGGPWTVNFGLPSVLTGETNGSFPLPNAVVGVTSWGYSTAAKEQGASPFTSNNIVSLLNSACGAVPAACN